jgi:hypothetical protein
MKFKWPSIHKWRNTFINFFLFLSFFYIYLKVHCQDYQNNPLSTDLLPTIYFIRYDNKPDKSRYVSKSGSNSSFKIFDQSRLVHVTDLELVIRPSCGNLDPARPDIFRLANRPNYQIRCHMNKAHLEYLFRKKYIIKV